MGTLRSVFAWSLVATTLAACETPAVKTPPAPPPPIEKTSSAAGREKVAITVYNSNFGLVREVRSVELAAGHISLEYADVSDKIQPETVALKALDNPANIDVLEQNYRYDLLTPQKLLEKYVGKQVKVLRFDEKANKDQPKDATVLSVEGGTLLQIGNEITAGYPGRITFPGVPDDLIAKPTLVWLLDSKAPKERLEVTYLTSNLNWKADYVLVVDQKDEKGDLHGWVTLSNETGTSYQNAELKLVAGDVQRVLEDQTIVALANRAPEEPSGGASFREEGLFEYHLYTLEHPTDVLDKEQKQVTLLDAAGIALKKRLVFQGSSHYFMAQYGQVSSNQKVGVFLEIDNAEANHMGMPLPKGVLRVYKADASGARQFIGEDAIDHTPRDEKLKIKLGEAFDVVGDRKQTEWKTLGKCGGESAFEIELRNHKDAAETVEIIEPINGDWEILESSLQSKKKDAHTFTFDATVPARGKTKVTYRVRVRWC